MVNIDGLEQDYSITIANAVEILQFCAKPSNKSNWNLILHYFKVGATTSTKLNLMVYNDDVIIWKRLPHYQPFVRESTDLRHHRTDWIDALLRHKSVLVSQIIDSSTVCSTAYSG